MEPKTRPGHLKQWTIKDFGFNICLSWCFFYWHKSWKLSRPNCDSMFLQSRGLNSQCTPGTKWGRAGRIFSTCTMLQWDLESQSLQVSWTSTSFIFAYDPKARLGKTYRCYRYIEWQLETYLFFKWRCGSGPAVNRVPDRTWGQAFVNGSSLTAFFCFSWSRFIGKNLFRNLHTLLRSGSGPTLQR